MRALVVYRFLLTFIILSFIGAASHAQDFATIYSRYKERVAHIEVVGELYDGTSERSSASGILIGFGLVLTNSHAIPRSQNYKRMVLNVRFGSRMRSPQTAEHFERDEERDLALLFLAPEVDEAKAGGSRCPMPALSDNDYTPPGTQVAVLGYPLDQDLSIAGGLLSNHGGPNDLRWQTDTVLNKGNSGGPFFAKDGTFAGIAVGGIVRFSIGQETFEVDGVNFLIPATVIRSSPLFGHVLELPDDRSCWIDFPSADAFDPRSFVGDKSQRIRVDRQFSATKDDHPVFFGSHSRVYSATFSAEPGYTIESCAWTAMSATRASDIRCDIVEDGVMANFSVQLTSGPAVDRWRGWWTGTISLEQSSSN